MELVSKGRAPPIEMLCSYKVKHKFIFASGIFFHRSCSVNCEFFLANKATYRGGDTPLVHPLTLLSDLNKAKRPIDAYHAAGAMHQQREVSTCTRYLKLDILLFGWKPSQSTVSEHIFINVYT